VQWKCFKPLAAYLRASNLLFISTFIFNLHTHSLAVTFWESLAWLLWALTCGYSSSTLGKLTRDTLHFHEISPDSSTSGYGSSDRFAFQDFLQFNTSKYQRTYELILEDVSDNILAPVSI